MKSILQSVALLSAAALIASCDSSSGGGAAAAVTPPAPQVSVNGSAVKGIIDGATVVATDNGGTGNQIGSSTVNNGTFSIAYDTGAFPTITDPIVVTVSNGSAICDFDNVGSANDCQQLDGSFVSFGQSYDITGTVLRANIASGSNGGVINSSPLSEIAASKAATPLTSAGVTQANLAISGLIEAVTGVSLGGVDFTQITPSNLAATGAVTDSPAQLAIAAFGAAVLGSQAAGETIGQTIARLAAGITVDPATGNITATGTTLATFATAYARGLTVAAARRPNGAISAAAASANANAAAFTAIGAGTVTVSPASTPGSTAPVDTTRAFVSKLSAVIGDLVGTTGAQGNGGQDIKSTTELFADELDAVAKASSSNVTTAFNKLDAAVRAAATDLAAGGTVTVAASETSGVGFTLTEASGTLTLTNVSSAWPIAAGAANRVVVTGGGTATGGATGSNNSFTLTGVSVVTANAAGTSTAQTFTGDAAYTFNTAGTTEGAVDTFDLTLTGSIVAGDADPSLNISLAVVADPVNPTGSSTRGTYSASFSFATTAAADVTVTFADTIGDNAQTFTIATPSGTITSTVTRAVGAGRNTQSDQVSLTDGNATLTLVALTNGSLPSTGTIGTFSVGTTDNVATLGADGIVTYTADNSIQILPLLLFPDPTSAAQ